MNSATNGVIEFSDLSAGPFITILSFLPFKDSVGTSVLSRQWQTLWLSSTNIELNEHYFVKDDDTPESLKSHRLEFINFVRWWMENFSNQTIDNLSLKLSKPEEFAEDVNRCISLALRKGVKRLELDFSDPSWDLEVDPRDYDGVFDLPPSVYEHRGLSSLSLSSCFFDVDKFRDNIMELKEVFVGYIPLHMSTVFKLVRKSPLLESLSLKRCWGISCFDLTGRPVQTLRTLVIDRCNFSDEYYGVEAPDLRVLKFSGLIGIFDLDLGRDVKEAELDFGQHDTFEECGDFLYQLLLSLVSARVLTVCSYMLQVIPTATEGLGMHHPLNVRHLILKTSVQPRDLWGISFFLKSCLLLETLTVQITPQKVLKNYESPFSSRHRFYVPNSRKFQCIFRTLKVVEVRGFKGTRGEMKLLNHLIKYGRVLIEVKLYVSLEGDEARYRESVETLLMTPRVSPRLQIMPYY